jgi:hypothetical protein
MSDLSSLTPALLRQAAGIKEQIELLTNQLTAILGGRVMPALDIVPVTEPLKNRKKYKLSAAGKAKRVAAQKARWERFNAGKTEAKLVKKGRRKMSPAGRAKIAAAARARWARVKAAKGG